MKNIVLFALAVIVLAENMAFGQGARTASPPGTAATEIGGKYVDGSYQGGKWIEITYGRPIKRGRNLWGEGPTYGKDMLSGAPVWRAGANVTTRLKTELPLVIGGKTVPPGDYSVFVDLKPSVWTLIISSWAAQEKYDPSNTQALWGSFGYTPDKDVVRAQMKRETLAHSVDQLTWQFLDMSNAGGVLALSWDKTLASVAFKAGS